VILIFHDISRIKGLENTRKEFVANVSHELRTPLALIKGYVETLIDGAKDDPKVACRFLRTIAKHADRLTYLIEDLLTISQLESGQAVMNQTCVEVQPLIERVSEDLRSRAEEQEVRIQIEGPDGLMVHADEDRIQQVLFNLMENGIKYGKRGGTLRVKARAQDGNRVEICVADNGPGIPEEARDRIFERFYRLDMARSREQGGTGLGLSIVKHIVQSHGGRVWVESPPGEGACFHFTLPAGERMSESFSDAGQEPAG
jgi:two-component system phosphate regulon sensor histidine kinase PhoR